MTSLTSTSVTARQEMTTEFANLALPGHCPIGLYVTPNADDIFKWSGVLFVHQGYYAGSVLHFLLTVPQSYPSSSPSVHFLSDVFHPLVDPATGRMDMSSRFPNWRPRVDWITHVLHYVKAAFKRDTLNALRESQCTNKEAYRLYREQTALFTKLASQSALLSTRESTLFSPDKHSKSVIKFRKLGGEEEDGLRRKLEAEGSARVIDRA